MCEQDLDGGERLRLGNAEMFDYLGPRHVWVVADELDNPNFKRGPGGREVASGGDADHTAGYVIAGVWIDVIELDHLSPKIDRIEQFTVFLFLASEPQQPILLIHRVEPELRVDVAEALT
jgi:hypothetical protein